MTARTIFRLFISALASTAIVTTTPGCYLTHLAKGQLHVVCSSISLEEALQSSCLTEVDKDKLRYVQEVRAFAETELGLSKSKNYTKYYPGKKEPISWSVAAAPKDSLKPVTWWFPIVGSISYKGYFNLKDAEEERDSLIADGYDACVRPALAYSTTGWFTDPILPEMLDLNEGALAFLIIHELAHGTLYAADQTTYNESLAEFVGREGARQFLEGKFGPASAQVKRYLDRLEDERLYDRFMNASARRLEMLYARHPADLEGARQEFFAQMRNEFDGLRSQFRTYGYQHAALGELNNAIMAGYLFYATTTPFEEAFEAAGRDWAVFWERVKDAAKSDNPFGKLRSLGS